MQKKEFITELMKSGEFSSINQANRILGVIFEEIKKSVEKEGELSFKGFGTFKKVVRAERDGVNPSTGDAMHIPAKNVIKFKPSKNFTELLNK